MRAKTFLLTWNPDIWPYDDWQNDYEEISSGGRVPGGWSVGSRRKGIQPGDRAFLLRQGKGARGIVASGWFTSEVYQDRHFNDPGKLANYADVEWDAMVDVDDPLPTADLKEQVTEIKWDFILGSGFPVEETPASTIEDLWDDHVGAVHSPDGVTAPGGQGRRLGAAERRAIENHAQRLLMDDYIHRGWDVDDRRNGNPFDAVATRDGEVVYLEAKGTTGVGWKVLVTQGEVEFARAHPGACVMGIVSGIVLNDDGTVDPNSGELEVVEWDPETGTLRPLTFSWEPDWE